MILCLETTTSICSVGIVDSHNPTRFALRESAQNDHAAVITLMIEACLKELNSSIHELKAVAISNGPGSYTSLRVGTSTAKGLCYALNIPLIAVETLASLALATYKKEIENGKKWADSALICPMIDARRMEVYCQLFRVEQTFPFIHSASDLSAQIIDNQSFEKEIAATNAFILCGNGAPKCQPTFENTSSVIFSEITECSAAYLFDEAILAFTNQHFVDVAYHTPQYFKAPNITVSKKNLLGV